MLRLTLRNIADRPFRFLLTTAAVVLGVMFVVATFITTDNLRDRFQELSLDIVGPNADLAIRTNLAVGDNDFSGNRLPLPQMALDLVADVPGVVAVEGRHQSFDATPITVDGQPIDTTPAPRLGFNWSGVDELAQLFLQPGGREPRYQGSIYDDGYQGEFLVDVDIAAEYGFEVGQVYTVAGAVGSRPFELVGLITFGDPIEHKTAGASFVAFDDRTAQEFFNRIGAYDYGVVALDPDADPVAVTAEIEQSIEGARDEIIQSYIADLVAVPEALPFDLNEVSTGGQQALEQLSGASVEVITAKELIEETEGQFDQILDILQNVLLAFAIIGVVVSAFIINNTFNIILGQRIRELALLRAIGATGRQVRNAVVIEALLVGVVATVLGFLLGIALAAGLRAALVALDFGDLANRYPLNPTTIVVGVVLGMGVTLLASLAPARRAQRVSPMAALREDLRLPASSLRRRITIGSLVLGLGIGSLVLAVVVSSRLLWLVSLVGFGALLVFLGVYLLSPLLSKPVAQLLGRPIQAVFGLPGRLARESAGGSPRRTAAAAAALTIGLALVSTAAVVADSVRATFIATLDDSVDADYFLFVSTFDPTAGFSREASERVVAVAEQDPTFESVARYRFALDGMAVNGDAKDVFGTELGLLVDHIDPGIVEGSLDGLGPRSIIIHRDPARDLGVAVGDPIVVQFPGGEEETLTLGAVYEDSTVIGNWTIPLELFNLHLPTIPDGFMTVNLSEGGDPLRAESALSLALAEYPNINIQDREEFRASQEQQLTVLLAIIIVFVLLSLVIAVLGIAITMALSVFERTRELGLLRAVGMTRRQVRRMIRWESVIIALFGGLLGVVIGTILGIAVAVVLPETFIDVISIPWPVLLGSLVAAGIFGIIAAFFPARRAGKLEILAAIATD
ncbi:MAG: FtsX-like permease family protein [Acidimicrobiia bacterium]|nr:FtsX-like permease family protein [Acidimicrobiia bacterium]